MEYGETPPRMPREATRRCVEYDPKFIFVVLMRLRRRPDHN